MDIREFKLSKISNVMLGVQDLSRAVAFYRDKLGLTVQFEIPGFAFLDGGGVTLTLSEPLAQAITAQAGKVAGAVEIVFAVDDVYAAYHALSARGIKFIHEPRNLTGSQWGANFEDPDGHILSIFGPQGTKEQTG